MQIIIQNKIWMRKYVSLFYVDMINYLILVLRFWIYVDNMSWKGGR